MGLLSTKIVTISELEQIDSFIKNAGNTSIVTTGLIEQCIDDLKANNKKVKEEKDGIASLIESFQARAEVLSKIYEQNCEFIEKLESAFKIDISANYVEAEEK